MAQWITLFPGYNWLLTTAKKLFGHVIQTGPTPRHVGIIMDGNRRYARTHNIELKEGHNLGFESMASILEILYECGVEHATVYAFSIENFKRLSYEVKWLMDLAKLKFKQITQHGDLCEEYGVKIQILGNIALLPKDVRKILKETEEMTKNNKRATLNVCFPYTSRDEMTYAIKSVVKQLVEQPDFVINEQTIDKFLYTKDSPPLDLLVRTSGTYRLSDFLLWQCVSSDCAIVMVDTLWPEFSPYHMAKILLNWGFNKYWYGNALGYSVKASPTPPAKSYTQVNDPDNDNDNSSVHSSADSLPDENDTVTSEDSHDIK